jgi:hypothetical protein
MSKVDTLDTKTATNFIRTALKLWLLDTGNSEVPRRTRVEGIVLIPAARHLSFDIYGDTSISTAFVRVRDGRGAWAASILQGCRTGKAHQTPAMKAMR